MSELEFNEALSKGTPEDDDFSCVAFASYLMAHANRQHRLAVEEAYARPIMREAAREYRKLRREKRLNAAVMAASVIGFTAAILFLAAIGAA